MKIFRIIYPTVIFATLVFFMIHISEIVTFGLCFLNILFSLMNLLRIKRKDMPYFKWLFVFLLFCSISYLWAFSPHLVLWVIIKQQIPIYALCLGIIVFVYNRDDFDKVLRSYYYAALILLLFVLINVDIANIGSSRLADDGEGDLWNPNYIGLYMALACYAGYFGIVKSQVCSKLFKLAFWIITLVMISLIMLSGSRGALLAMIVPLCFKQLYGNTNIIKTGIVITLICAVVYLLVMKVPVLYEIIGVRIEELFNIFSGSDDGSGDDSRLILILSGLIWFQDSPILGVGINNFRVLSGKYLPYSKEFYAHNNYVELLVDVGLVGFLIYYSIYFFLIRKHKRMNSKYKAWFMGFIVFSLIADFTNVSYYEFSLQLLICLLFCSLKVDNFKNRKEICM
ncbi:MAG: O-antigen ligase family protein [Alistipes sp.]|nr:O-antigen ligase family protein [Alistipes sp.]